jgi:hypothetical protein
MPSDLDIYHSAKLLMHKHGKDASNFAAMRADKCLATGDLDGKAVWVRVIWAIEELWIIEELTKTDTPEDRLPVH